MFHQFHYKHLTIVISENWPARCEAIPDHPHSLDSGIIEEYLSGKSSCFTYHFMIAEINVDILLRFNDNTSVNLQRFELS